MRTLNDFQKLLGDTTWLWPTIGLANQVLSNLFQTLQGDKDLNSPRKLSTEARKDLALIERKLEDIHVDRIDPRIRNNAK